MVTRNGVACAAVPPPCKRAARVWQRWLTLSSPVRAVVWTQRCVYACVGVPIRMWRSSCVRLCVFLLRVVLHINTAITYNVSQCALTQRRGSRNEPQTKTRRDDNGGAAAKQEGRGGRVSDDSCACVSVCSLAIAPFSSSLKLRGSCPSFPSTAQRPLRIPPEARERRQSSCVRRHTDTHEKIW